MAAFKEHAKQTYDDARTVDRFKAAWVPLVDLYGDTPAADFGPLKLKAVRTCLIAGKRGLRTRRHVNTLVNTVRHIFKWAASEELVPATVYHALLTVVGLRHGRTEAREADRVRPVPQQHVDAIRPYLSRQVAAMIDLQLLTAARPGELCVMRPVDLDTTDKVWTYKPVNHKTAWRGRDRVVYLGPKAQDLIRPFLAGRAVDAYLFSPAEAVAEQREERHAERVTPLSCGNKPGSNVRRHPKKTPGDRFTANSYHGAIQYACDRAWPAPDAIDDKALRQWRHNHRWHPHQLRHNAGTNIRKQFGLDVAAVMLGHARCDVSIREQITSSITSWAESCNSYLFTVFPGNVLRLWLSISFSDGGAVWSQFAVSAVRDPGAAHCGAGSAAGRTRREDCEAGSADCSLREAHRRARALGAGGHTGEQTPGRPFFAQPAQVQAEAAGAARGARGRDASGPHARADQPNDRCTLGAMSFLRWSGGGLADP
ncbi:MAG: site-specific integrase [Planctomycetota bacterium]